MVESHGYYRSPQLSGGDGYGLWQWNKARRDIYENGTHKKFSDMTEDGEIRYMMWEMQNQPLFKSTWAALTHSNLNAASLAKMVAFNYERMANKNGDPEKRAAIADLLNTIPVDTKMSLAPPTSPPPEVDAYLRRQAAKARSVGR